MQDKKSSASTLIAQSSEIASSFDQLIDRELVKFDSVIPKIEELKSEYLPLKIADIHDTDGYAEVANALRFVVSKRTAIEDKRKELKSDSLKFGKAVDDKAKEYTALLAPIEAHLRAEKTKIDEEREKIKKQKEEEEKKRIQARQNTLIELGMRLNPFNDLYSWQYDVDGVMQEETLHSMNIELYDETEWMSFVDRMKELNKSKAEYEERLKQERLLEQKRQDEESKRLKEEAERLQEEKKKQEDESRRLQEERDALILERTGARYDQLHIMGLIASIAHNGAHGFVHFDRTFSVIVEDEFIKKSSASDWSVALPNILEKVSLFKQEDEEKRKFKQKEEDDRLEKIRQDAIAKDKADRQAKEAEDTRLEKERMEQMSDKEKVSHYMSKVNSIEKPTLKTVKWNKAFSQFVFYLNSVAEMK